MQRLILSLIAALAFLCSPAQAEVRTFTGYLPAAPGTFDLTAAGLPAAHAAIFRLGPGDNGLAGDGWLSVGAVGYNGKGCILSESQFFVYENTNTATTVDDERVAISPDGDTVEFVTTVSGGLRFELTNSSGNQYRYHVTLIYADDTAMVIATAATNGSAGGRDFGFRPDSMWIMAAPMIQPVLEDEQSTEDGLGLVLGYADLAADYPYNFSEACVYLGEDDAAGVAGAPFGTVDTGAALRLCNSAGVQRTAINFGYNATTGYTSWATSDGPGGFQFHILAVKWSNDEEHAVTVPRAQVNSTGGTLWDYSGLSFTPSYIEMLTTTVEDGDEDTVITDDLEMSSLGIFASGGVGTIGIGMQVDFGSSYTGGFHLPDCVAFEATSLALRYGTLVPDTNGWLSTDGTEWVTTPVVWPCMAIGE